MDGCRYGQGRAVDMINRTNKFLNFGVDHFISNQVTLNTFSVTCNKSDNFYVSLFII